MKNPDNCFIVNLAVSDICMALFNCFPFFIFMRDGNWRFGPLLCTVGQFNAHLNISVSVFTMLALTRLRLKVTKKVV